MKIQTYEDERLGNLHSFALIEHLRMQFLWQDMICQKQRVVAAGVAGYVCKHCSPQHPSLSLSDLYPSIHLYISIAFFDKKRYLKGVLYLSLVFSFALELLLLLGLFSNSLELREVGWEPNGRGKNLKTCRFGNGWCGRDIGVVLLLLVSISSSISSCSRWEIKARERVMIGSLHHVWRDERVINKEHKRSTWHTGAWFKEK